MKRLLLFFGLFVGYQLQSAEVVNTKASKPRYEKIKKVLYSLGNELDGNCYQLLKEYQSGERGKDLLPTAVKILKQMKTIASFKSYVFRTTSLAWHEKFREELAWVYYHAFKANHVFEIVKTDFLLQHISEKFIKLVHDLFLYSKIDFFMDFSMLIPEVSWLDNMYPSSAEKKSEPLEFVELPSLESALDDEDLESIGSWGSDILDIGIE